MASGPLIYIQHEEDLKNENECNIDRWNSNYLSCTGLTSSSSLHCAKSLPSRFTLATDVIQHLQEHPYLSTRSTKVNSNSNSNLSANYNSRCLNNRLSESNINGGNTVQTLKSQTEYISVNKILTESQHLTGKNMNILVTSELSDGEISNTDKISLNSSFYSSQGIWERPQNYSPADKFTSDVSLNSLPYSSCSKENVSQYISSCLFNITDEVLTSSLRSDLRMTTNATQKATSLSESHPFHPAFTWSLAVGYIPFAQKIVPDTSDSTIERTAAIKLVQPVFSSPMVVKPSVTSTSCIVQTNGREVGRLEPLNTSHQSVSSKEEHTFDAEQPNASSSVDQELDSVSNTSNSHPTHSAVTCMSKNANISLMANESHSRTCCLCWCCCCVHSRVRIRTPPGEIRMTKLDEEGLLSQEPKVSYEEVNGWSESFDNLMGCFNSDEGIVGQTIFRKFLRFEYSEENILFWLACEDLKVETKPDMVYRKARNIYEDYISILSPREVSLDSRVREIINKNISNPTPKIFDEAQFQIYTLMQRDSYPRFLNSKIFKDLLEQTRISSGK